MYADDTHLTHADKDVNIIQSCLNEDLLNNSKWLIANKLTLNMTRTELMLIGSRQKLNTLTASPVLSINSTLVNQVSLSKFLGVLIDANLNWGSHQTGRAIRSPSNAASYLQSLDSAVAVWGNCGIKLADKLQNSKIGQREH